MSEEHIAKAHQEIATRNSMSAVKAAQDSEKRLNDRIDFLENLVRTQHEQIAQLQNKYNLLLSSRFSSGSTSTEH
jgi:hypothetical protein